MVWVKTSQLWGWYWIAEIQLAGAVLTATAVHRLCRAVTVCILGHHWLKFRTEHHTFLAHSDMLSSAWFYPSVAQPTQEGTWYWALIYKLWAQDKGNYLIWPADKTKLAFHPLIPPLSVAIWELVWKIFEWNIHEEIKTSLVLLALIPTANSSLHPCT